MTTLDTMRAAYLAEIDALVARYPGQMQNRPSYEHNAASMRLGFLRTHVKTKLHDFPAGLLVAFIPDDAKRDAMRREEGFTTPMVSIWAPDRSYGSTLTMIASGDVEPSCATCDGSGTIRYVDGFVSFTCPHC